MQAILNFKFREKDFLFQKQKRHKKNWDHRKDHVPESRFTPSLCQCQFMRLNKSVLMAQFFKDLISRMGINQFYNRLNTKTLFSL